MHITALKEGSQPEGKQAIFIHLFVHCCIPKSTTECKTKRVFHSTESCVKMSYVVSKQLLIENINKYVLAFGCLAACLQKRFLRSGQCLSFRELSPAESEKVVLMMYSALSHTRAVKLWWPWQLRAFLG